MMNQAILLSELLQSGAHVALVFSLMAYASLILGSTVPPKPTLVTA